MACTIRWQTSSFSSNGSNCVEVRESTDAAWLRDSKDRGRGPVVSLTATQWSTFLAEVADDRPSANGAVRVRIGPDGGRRVEDTASGTVLGFTPGEWLAFRSGVLAGEFGPVVAGPGAALN